jgi:hypothetical protein
MSKHKTRENILKILEQSQKHLMHEKGSTIHYLSVRLETVCKVSIMLLDDLENMTKEAYDWEDQFEALAGKVCECIPDQSTDETPDSPYDRLEWVKEKLKWD